MAKIYCVLCKVEIDRKHDCTEHLTGVIEARHAELQWLKQDSTTPKIVLAAVAQEGLIAMTALNKLQRFPGSQPA